MILILLNWFYVFFTSINIGISFSRFLKITKSDFVTQSFLGLFASTLLGSIWALYGGINFYFYLSFLLVNLGLAWQNKSLLKNVLHNVKANFKSFPKSIKALFITTVLSILFQCAKTPSITDNESYYIQTIKWLNDYGFVKGLGNLHLFLGQNSGWHITQSIFNFSFIYSNFNDINGYCLVLFSFFSFLKLSQYFKTNNKVDLFFGLLSLANLFFFQFISAPSPDLPVYVLTYIAFSLFLEQELSFEGDAFTSMTILILYAMYIKMTAAPLLILPIILLVNHFITIKKRILSIGIISFLVLILYSFKNIILTGYPLFPLTLFRCDWLDYTIPKEILSYFSSSAMRNEFFISMDDYNRFSIKEIIFSYFFHSGIEGIMGLITLFSLLFSPILIYLKKLPKEYWVLYISFLLLLLIVIITSPQVRFYIHFTIFFTAILFSFWIKNKKTAIFLLLISTVITTGFACSTSSSNINNKKLSIMMFPNSNSNWDGNYTVERKGNLQYNSPGKNSYFWATGNGKLPCVNSKQLDYFETYFYYMPQLRSNNLKDGFYSKKITPHE